MEPARLMVATASEVLGHRTALDVTNRLPCLRSQALTQRWDFLEGPRRAAVWIRKEGRLRDKLVASRVAGETTSPSCTTKDLSSRDRPLWEPRGQRRNGLPRQGAHLPRPECHILQGDGRLAARLVSATMKRGFVCKPAVRSLMPVLIEITTLDARYASRASDTAPSSRQRASPVAG